ncbi:MAG: MBL fold metallo-hydrolase [Solirubrobacteraceae bacterium]
MTGPPPPAWAVDPEAVRTAACAEGIERLRLPLPWPGIDHVNAYAIERDDGLLLVDCGSDGHPSCAHALGAALADAGHDLSDVRVLAITHAHSDHSGLAELVRARSGCDVLIHPNHAHFYRVFSEPRAISAARERRARQEGVPHSLLAACADVREELEGAQALGRTRPLSDGISVASTLGEWEAMHTPGHAPSHVCLLARERGIAIVGDVLCRAFVPWFDYGCTADPVAEYLRSLARLAEQAPALALTGHGRPLEDVPAAIVAHRAGVAARLDATRAALREPARGAYQVALRVFGEQSDAISAVDRLTETAAYLRHLRLAGEAERRTLADGTFLHLLRVG